LSKARLRRGAIGFGLLIAMSGCYTTKNVATFSALDTSYPVSASAQYIDNQGALVTPKDYQVVKNFYFLHEVKGPRHEESTGRLNLRPELDNIMAKEHGDAMTRIIIDVADYQPGSHYTSGGLKVMGWTLGVSGLFTLAFIPAAQDKDDVHTLAAIGGSALGLGALFYVRARYIRSEQAVRLELPCSWGSGAVEAAANLEQEIGPGSDFPTP